MRHLVRLLTIVGFLPGWPAAAAAKADPGAAAPAVPGATAPGGADLAIAILELRSGQGIGPEAAEPLQMLLAGQLGESGRPVKGASQVTQQLAARRDLADCARGACLEEVAVFLKAAKLVGGVIRRAGPERPGATPGGMPGMVVELWMYDRDSRESVTADASCARCAIKQAPELVERAATDLLAQDGKRRVPATVDIRSEPAAARVVVDGQGVGVTPISLRLAAGPHGIVVERAGYTTQSRDISPAAGEAVELAFTLEPALALLTPPPVSAGVPDALVVSSDVPERNRISPTWKWAAWAGAVAAIGAGGVLLAIDGRNLERVHGSIEETRQRESTAEGVVALAIGGACAATGFVLWRME